MLLEAVMETRAVKQVLGHPRDPVLAKWFGADLSTAGVAVDDDSALNYSACWAATRILCGTGGMLPLKMYRHVKGGGKEEASERPEYSLVHDRPNPNMGSMMFRSSRIKFQVNSGNGYAEIERNGRGELMWLWPIHPTRVTPVYSPDNDLYYEVKNPDGTKGDIAADDMLHFPSIISDDGICGKGVITHARESIGMGIATERHGAALFGNGARPGFVVRHPNKMSDEARKNFRREWNEIYQGPENAHKMALLAEGADITPLGFNNNDSQFIETRQHNIEEIARWYGVPPHMIQHLLRATFNNIEHMSVEFVTYSLMPWLVIWEQELNRKLLSEEDRQNYFFEHVVDGLLRGDALTRAQALQIQHNNGALNDDEWRSIENRNPIPNGDGQKFFVPLNMTTIEKAGEEPVVSPAAPASGGKDIADTMPGKSTSMPNEQNKLLAHFKKPRGLETVYGDLLSQSLARLFRDEAQAARYQAKINSSGFIGWSDKYFLDRQQKYKSELTPIFRVITAVFNPCIDAESLSSFVAIQHLTEAKQDILTASGAPLNDFREAVDQCVTVWENAKPIALARTIIESITHGLPEHGAAA